MRTIFFLIFSAYFLLSVIAIPLPRVLPCQASEKSTRITCDISSSILPPTGTLSSEELSPQLLEKRDSTYQKKLDAAKNAWVLQDKKKNLQIDGKVGSVGHAAPVHIDGLPLLNGVFV